jgi:hypothetical protein
MKRKLAATIGLAVISTAHAVFKPLDNFSNRRKVYNLDG